MKKFDSSRHVQNCPNLSRNGWRFPDPFVILLGFASQASRRRHEKELTGWAGQEAGGGLPNFGGGGQGRKRYYYYSVSLFIYILLVLAVYKLGKYSKHRLVEGNAWAWPTRGLAVALEESDALISLQCPVPAPAAGIRGLLLPPEKMLGWDWEQEKGDPFTRAPRAKLR